MNKRNGFYPAVRVDTAGSGVVSHAGAVTLLETRPRHWPGPGVVRFARPVAQTARAARPGEDDL